MQADYPKIRRRLLAEQGFSCAICGRSDERRWDLDHDHSCCGQKDMCESCIRGVLCRKCNRMVLGGANDDVKILRAAIEYLEGHAEN